MSKSARVSDLPSRYIDGIDRRVAQLSGLFGLLLALDHEASDPTIYAKDFCATVWLLQDVLDEIHRHAQALFKQTQEVRP